MILPSFLMVPPEILFFLAYASRFGSFLVTVSPKILVLFACAEQILVFFGYGWVFSPHGRVFFPYSLPFLPYSSVSLGRCAPKLGLVLLPCRSVFVTPLCSLRL